MQMLKHLALATTMALAAITPATAQDAEMTVPTNGIAYNVKTWGDPADPAVLLLHGWMGTSHTWRKPAPLLAEDRFVIVPDMRGYTGSDKPATGYDAVTLATDVPGLLDHFDKPQAHVVGHDMGALMALVLAGTFPDRAQSLTYLDEPLVGYNLDQFTVYREETYGGYWHFGFNTAPGLAEILVAGTKQAFVDWFVPLMHAPNPDAVTEDDRRIYADSLRQPGGISGSVGWYRASFETARQIRAIGEAGFAVPILAFRGQYGVPPTYEQMELISDDVQGGVIPNAGHLLAEEVPEFLGPEITTFWAGVEAR